ncbi:hypothetical protein A3F07_01885 [candidate division WWE3 bacterium RIFCSPHIGHO2_12_FULL_38_15]|uniref:Regulatory protein RecX n=1 Tax=candidate division WWE3 bacterium RIFCSPHIGHO2_02_FULL_38_14 TaxID=1802620 RepID=A0A1F4VBE1_UNCKA|nr:MAG: hypothetical protein A2793_04290 [candidate division WWE3 bacterium RIFCSPHIGHO2_01_FULL_38_45]OGC48454.1 MAG: hypothetical protein A3F07_01885 [candidate division WWE3 bacterium RIFCSPHIGHO2_12_FULL_38_15]OGC52885.1 MAG: hypothetical protein A3B64_03660 [candidate division WWE3 bacterium RIFCSPLOWO2_01_FULL_37_24]OGC54388.1 MAG: hypothetical protein A3D91_00635 [candidate division WWE3 bacterium RIFCSPHIGHO2_02_FULL_38_14]HLB51632.1 regulatory protein RecX [Patescibacteria group bacter
MIENKKLNFKILDKVVNFLSYRLRSSKEISDRLEIYLSKEKITEEEKAAIKSWVIAELQTLGMINDYNFASTFVEEKSHSRKPLSRFAVQNYLYRRGISKEIIKEVLIDYTKTYELASAMVIAEKKLGSMKKGLDKMTVKRKLISYLIGKGFSPESVYTVVDTKFKVK